MTLYLKYRPTNLDELDLTEVSESLKKILSNKNIPHAFLFAGPKGTGKTSAARILAKVINCENLKNGKPCDKCEQCLSITRGSNLDVVEMDAASHRGIDDVRVLRDAVKLTPVSSKKKIYIIDEAHMLTTEASNALLKTLEEPPAHVVFILATTNPEKLIDTIKSRVTYIHFKKATDEEIARSLKRVIDGEKMKIDSETLSNITKAANGSFRDAIKILEQVGMEGAEFLDKNDNSDINGFVDFIEKRDLEKSLESVKKYVNSGSSIENIIKEVLSKVQEDLLKDISGKRELIELIDLLIEANKNIPDSPIEELPLEIALIKWCGGGEGNHLQSVRLEINSPAVPHGTDRDGLRSETSANHDLAQTEISSTRGSSSDFLVSECVNNDAWVKILSLVKPINASIEALLRSSRPVNYDGKTLTLGVYYKFHKERLEDVRHRKILEDVIGKVLNSPTRVICVTIEPPVKQIVEEAKVETVLTEGKDRDIIKAAEEIFSN